MSRTPFNSGWRVAAKASLFEQLSSEQNAVQVTLPHDAMVSSTRSADAPAAASAGYFPGGWVEYHKTFAVPREWRTRRVSLTFEGVYRDAKVFVNGDIAGGRPSGYAEFTVRLDPFLRYGQENRIRVEARAHCDSRWYSGLGIYRPVTLVVTDLVHLDQDKIVVRPRHIDSDGALIEIATSVSNDDIVTRTVSLRSTLSPEDTHIVVGADTAPLTLAAGTRGTVRQRIYLAGATRWSVDHPFLYAAYSQLLDNADVLDENRTTFGVRTLQADAIHGLRINGETIKLRGACIHHDNGVLGAATIARADERRVELLKAAGFNAIRSAHNPLARGMLDACDRLGMLVMDEAFDMWNETLNPFDYSLAFPDWWERDLEAMVAKDINHPSVIMYSVGNEIPDTGRPLGATWSRQLAEKIRELDPSRLVTNAVSGFIATIGEVVETRRDVVDDLIGRGGANVVIDQLADRMNTGELYDFVTDRTAETHATVDIVAHNYAEARFARDRERYPNRVVVGSESVAKNIDRIWAEVSAHPHVIGDFCWTGWDYIGEAGLGGVMYQDSPDTPYSQPWPWLLAWSGDLDITGQRRPQSHYREIVFGQRHDPYIAVCRPQPHGSHVQALEWAWSDSIASWTWSVDAGTPLTVEVYAHAAEVELVLNGESLGTRPTDASHRYRAEFVVPYRAGNSVAVARTNDIDVGRHTLRSATGATRLTADVDRPVIAATDADLAFITIELVGENGVLDPTSDRAVEVRVDGAGVLQGLGSARPASPEPYHQQTHRTFDGRALAVIRPTGPGDIRVEIASAGLQPVTVRLQATEIERCHP